MRVGNSLQNCHTSQLLVFVLVSPLYNPCHVTDNIASNVKEGRMAIRARRRAASKKPARGKSGSRTGARFGASLARHSDAADAHTKAMKAHESALDAHTESLFVSAAVTKAVSREGIRRVLAGIFGVVNPNDVKDSEPLTDYIAGGPAAIIDFGNTLNSRFAGLHLTPADMKGVTKVGRLIDLILKKLV